MRSTSWRQDSSLTLDCDVGMGHYSSENTNATSKRIIGGDLLSNLFVLEALKEPNLGVGERVDARTPSCDPGASGSWEGLTSEIGGFPYVSSMTFSMLCSISSSSKASSLRRLSCSSSISSKLRDRFRMNGLKLSGRPSSKQAVWDPWVPSEGCIRVELPSLISELIWRSVCRSSELLVGLEDLCLD
ncbi:hypothetical protein HWI79_1234 [Cryptosporidium felis]|nr:hypothetical protein HWI79_1234 [Cryptosporidium felis]